MAGGQLRKSGFSELGSNQRQSTYLELLVGSLQRGKKNPFLGGDDGSLFREVSTAGPGGAVVRGGFKTNSYEKTISRIDITPTHLPYQAERATGPSEADTGFVSLQPQCPHSNWSSGFALVAA